MAQFYDQSTGFFIGDPEIVPLSRSHPTEQEIAKAFAPLILSASGWRKIFAKSEDEESAERDIGSANEVIAAHIADVFADYLLGERDADDARAPKVALGMDTRPTGAAIADVMCRVFLARGLEVHHVFVAAAPEIMAYAREIGAFAYISASHNPIGHNGVKFGLADGGVLSGEKIGPLIAALKTACAVPDAGQKAAKLIAECPRELLSRAYETIDEEKKRSIAAYRAFSREVVSGEGDQTRQNAFFGFFSQAAETARARGKPVSLLCDFNGSARSQSIDRFFFEEMGIHLFSINGEAGKIAHRIVPEGDSLSFCAREIERLRSEGTTDEERNVSMGYVPDCDGDRGNIVYWDRKAGRAEILQAQEVFALSVIAEFAHLFSLGKVRRTAEGATEPPLAIAVNDPTSMMIDAIAARFGATVARAEVGEANVVNLARDLRQKGFLVRILGEGSNGGNITHPAAVRDPLNTVMALLKLLVIGEDGNRRGPFGVWCDLSGQEEKYRKDFDLTDVIDTLPPFVTTSVFEKDAMLSVSTLDHAALKRKFQAIFEREWAEKKASLRQDFGFASWVAISNNGTAQTMGLTDFGESKKGGLKIQFVDREGKPAAFIWMRGSGTEPVFRVLADARGADRAIERYLLGWLTGMVLEADGKI